MSDLEQTHIIVDVSEISETEIRIKLYAYLVLDFSSGWALFIHRCYGKTLHEFGLDALQYYVVEQLKITNININILYTLATVLHTRPTIYNVIFERISLETNKKYNDVFIRH